MKNRLGTHLRCRHILIYMQQMHFGKYMSTSHRVTNRSYTLFVEKACDTCAIWHLLSATVEHLVLSA